MMMVVMMLVVVLIMVVIVVMAAAGAVLIMLIVVVVMMLVVVIVVMAAAGAVLVMLFVVMMVVLVLVFIVVMVVMAAASAVLVMLFVVMIVVMVVLVLGLLGKELQLLFKGILVLHRLENLCAGELIPRGGNDGGVLVVLAQQSDAGFKLFGLDTVRAAQNDGVCVLDLVVIELAEVLHIHFALVCIGNGGEAIQRNVFHVQVLHGTDHIAQLAYAGRLDQNAVRVVGLQHLTQRLSEVAHKAAADAALAHLGDFNAGVLQKAAVNGNLAELVFDEDELFALKSFGDQLADQRGFACAEEAGKNIDFRHILMPFRNNLRFAFLVRPRSFAVLTTCF